MKCETESCRGCGTMEYREAAHIIGRRVDIEKRIHKPGIGSKFWNLA